MSGAGWEAVIGLEVHVQLATATKLFCGDAAEFGAPPNAHVCPVCLGLPGALPVLNERAVELAARAALALGCRVHASSDFARKAYFYPDLPKGYQVTQFEHPLATGGRMTLDPGPDAADGGERLQVRVRRIHLEEDAGRSLHDRFPDATAIDFNRAGVPLIEIVTEPDLRTPGQARTFLTRLKRTLQYLEVSDCDMEKGSLRVDANVSVRPAGTTALGTRTEVKNLNSFAQVERALRYEIERQLRLVAGGSAVVHETLHWDAGRGVARSVRGKEEEREYRYFPEPDLPPLELAAAWVAGLRAALPELPDTRAARLRRDWGLPAYDAEVLTASRPLADYFEATAAAVDPKLASNWIMRDVLGWLNRRRRSIRELSVTPAALAELIRLADEGRITVARARHAFGRMAETGLPASTVLAEAERAQAGEAERAQASDAERIAAWVDEAIAEHPAEAARCRAGERRLLAFFMGQVMRKAQGGADPTETRRTLEERLEG
jgi:aspartyl-tRNA(Asn)/glutamyl-tRNA(Gln) amidotransferase subunit B